MSKEADANDHWTHEDAAGCGGRSPPVIVTRPKPRCDACGSSIDDFAHRMRIATNEDRPRFKCGSCDATEYLWCPKCFFAWRDGFSRLVPIGCRSGVTHICSACVLDHWDGHQKAFRFLLTSNEWSHMKVVDAYVCEHGMPLPEVMSRQEIILPMPHTPGT